MRTSQITQQHGRPHAGCAPLLFQYTSTGRISGYGGHLDLDLFYGDANDWRRSCAVADDESADGVSPSGSVDELARKVIAGEFGNGNDRKRRLGPNYSAVQRRVNEMLGVGSSVDIDALARVCDTRRLRQWREAQEKAGVELCGCSEARQPDALLGAGPGAGAV